MANTNITLAATRKAVLINPEKHNGFTHKWTIPYADVVASAATGTSDTVSCSLGATPAKWAITGGAINVTTAFAGVTSQALAASLGVYGGDVAAVVPSTSVAAAGLKAAATGAQTVTNIANCQAQTSSTLGVVFTNSAAGSPSTLTAGSMDVYVRMVDLSQLG